MSRLWVARVLPRAFEQPDEAQFRSDFDRQGRNTRHELWIVLLLVITLTLVFHRVLLAVPEEVLPLGRMLLVAVAVPAVLRWLSGDRSPIHRWSSQLYIASVYIDIGCAMVLRIKCIEYGLDVVPLIMPVAVLMSLVAVQIRFALLAPAMLIGLIGIIATELWAFDATSNRLFELAASTALVVVAVGAAAQLERWTRLGWLRERRLDQLTRVDPLTGMPNRRHFDAELHDAIESAARTGGWVGLMILDVDRFKSFNDRFGHPAGDDCLRRVGLYLNEPPSQPRVFVARLGGEEFAALWRAPDPSSIHDDAERLRAGVGQLGIDGVPGDGDRVTASAGLVVARIAPSDHDPGLVASDLLRRADGALYEAKRAGRDNLVVAGDAARSPSRKRAPGRVARPGPDTPAGPAEVVSTFLQPYPLREPWESEFRAAFEEQGRDSRAHIMIGLLAVCAFILAFDRSVLEIPEKARLIGQITLVTGLMPVALLALLGSTWPRLYKRSAQLYIAAVAVITAAQMIERVIQLPHGYDVVPILMPISVLLSLCVVQIRFALLLPSALLVLLGISTLELAAFPWTSNRLLTIGAAAFMTAVGLRFAYRIERSFRIAWSRQRMLDHLTRIDALTGLPNRRSFDQVFEEMIRRSAAENTGVALMVLDIDHFKEYNDTHGHLAGDAALRSVGAYLETLGVFAARIGGEEFATVWPIDPDVDPAIRAAEIHRRLSDVRAPVDGGYRTLSASAGFARSEVRSTEPSVLAHNLMASADGALYAAKRGGRCQLVELDPERGRPTLLAPGNS